MQPPVFLCLRRLARLLLIHTPKIAYLSPHPVTISEGAVKKIIATFIICATAILLSPTPARAGDTGIDGFNALFFRPNVDGMGIFNIDAANTLRPGSANIAGYFQYARHTVSFSDPALHGLVTDLVENQVLANFTLGIGLFEFLDAGMDIPIALMQNGTNCGNTTCTAVSNYSGAGLGDIRFVLKLRLVKDEPGSVGLALASDIGIPTGNRRLFTGGDGASYEQRLIVSKSFKQVDLSANVGYRAVKKAQAMGLTYDDALTFGGGARVKLPKQMYAYATVAGTSILAHDGSGRTPVEFMGGVGHTWKNGVSCDIGGGVRVVDGVSAADYRAMGRCGIAFDLIKKHESPQKSAAQLAPPEEWVIPMQTNQWRLDREQKEMLEDLIRWLAIDRGRQVMIAGNADDRASFDYNMKLSTRRALAARDYLIGHGVPPEQLVLSTRGEALPLKQGKTEEARGENRSIVIQEMRNVEAPNSPTAKAGGDAHGSSDSGGVH